VAVRNVSSVDRSLVGGSIIAGKASDATSASSSAAAWEGRRPLVRAVVGRIEEEGIGGEEEDEGRSMLGSRTGCWLAFLSGDGEILGRKKLECVSVESVFYAVW
jgi:hypothetical protein